MRYIHKILVCAGFALFSAYVNTPALAAQSNGDGGCVITPDAPVYQDSTQDKVVGALNVGDCLIGIKHVAALHPDYLFAKRDGRVWVEFFPNKDERGSFTRGWMRPTDLSTFMFACYCADECSPYKLAGLKFVYNLCFTDARDKKKAELSKQNQPVSAAAQGGEAVGRRAEGALRNADIVSLTKVGLDDTLIISKVKAAAAIDFDLSTDGLVNLKKERVSNAVIESMMKRADGKK